MSQKLNFYTVKGSGDFTTFSGKAVLVFGSNPEGRHGRGLANFAMKHAGAKYTIGRGLQGNSYALVTKNLRAGYTEPSTGIVYEKEGYASVSLEQIRANIEELYQCCRDNPELRFIVGYKNGGKTLNGYYPAQLFNLFVENIEVPDNVYFHSSFKEIYYGNE